MPEAARKALIVDDDAEVRAVLTTLLNGHGWDTVEGEDGTDALYLAVEEGPDLIILDVMMPTMSGIEALKELRDDPRTGHIPVVMLSAVNDYDLGSQYDAESISRRFSVRPPDDFFEKPVDAAQFLEAIERIVAV